jgi:hypothetical protein
MAEPAQNAGVNALERGGVNAALPIVANNHKMPAALFQEHRLAIAEIVDSTVVILQKIKSENADLQVVLTVSPVRHLRGGAVANQRSKATLVLACEEICRQLPFTCYFPAYELLLDDLRDYRFYASDMVHPSDTAVNYIWDFRRHVFFGRNKTAERAYRKNHCCGTAPAFQSRYGRAQDLRAGAVGGD